jgi:cytochrome oxidase Cu insertion factor (SCO1/SenC/PrrC family)
MLGGLLAVGLAVFWFRRLNQVRIPADRRPFLMANAVAAALGVVALLLGAGVLGSILALVAILGGATFLGLAAQSRQLPLQPAVAVGEPILDFTLPDHQGQPFHLASLRGTPFLLKFFRGHW